MKLSNGRQEAGTTDSRFPGTYNDCASVPSLDDAKDLYDVRTALESLLVERFVERATGPQKTRLAAAVEDFAEASATDVGIQGMLQVKDAFFEALLAGADSPALQELLEGVQCQLRMLRAVSISSPGRGEQAVHELRAVLNAIQDGDGLRAVSLYSEHIDKAAHVALQNIYTLDNGLQQPRKVLSND